MYTFIVLILRSTFFLLLKCISRDTQLLILMDVMCSYNYRIIAETMLSAQSSCVHSHCVYLIIKRIREKYN